MIIFLFLLLLARDLIGDDDFSDQLFQDLETVEAIDRKIHDKLPVPLNSQLQGGYFTMPSARMVDAGVIGLSYSYLPPYRLWNLSLQLFDHLELTGNYWIFHGILEPGFGHMGFGDDAERSANVKIALLKREDGIPFLPNFAIGWNDFIGTMRMHSFYAVATQEFLDANLEATLGWGTGRIQGFYGGLAISPFRHTKTPLKGLLFAAEYDANNYRRHIPEHPLGRKIKSRINAGIQYKIGPYFQLSANTLRGTDWAAGALLQYNFGTTNGLFPKDRDPCLFRAPIDREPIGLARSRQEFAHEIAYAFKEQGFDLYSLYLIPGKSDSLWVKVLNLRYREEQVVRERLVHVLAALAPANIEWVTVVVEADGVLAQSYRFRACDLIRYREGRLGDAEFHVIAPIREASLSPSPHEAVRLYMRYKPVVVLTFRPRFYSYFGSSTGKFKYAVALTLGPEGYLFDEIYYSVLGSYTIKSVLQRICPQDRYNPSHLLQVRTDTILYQQSGSVHLEQAFLQKSWNLGQGWFTRFGAGYFELAYGGVSWETLYYPVQADWALGIEAATVWKRRYFGIGFTPTVRKFNGTECVEVPFVGVQYFADLYYNYKPLNLDFKFALGQFLARDKGLRTDVGRTYPSGLRIGFWYTVTNGNDVINHHRYYDKGFSITMPLDLFMRQSSRNRVGYAMAAWLRDVGAKAATGKELYPTLYYERYNPRPVLY